MDVVLRTPNGEAELSLGHGYERLSVAELVELVIGREAGRLVYVDGRAVPSSTMIGAAGVLAGSIVSTADDVATAPTDAVVELIQVAGPGSGARSALTPGRYRIGSGRRIHARELDHAPVDSAMFELAVSATGDVDVSAGAVRVRLDGAPVSGAPQRWDSGWIDVAGRVFALGGPPMGGVPVMNRTGTPGADGTVAFNRPPRSLPDPEPDRTRPPDDARRRAARARLAHHHLADLPRIAALASPALWERRPHRPDAFRLPVGVADQESTPDGPESLALVPVVVDVWNERGVGIVGDADRAEALVRALVLQAAVLHGPADVDIVVLTSPGRAPAWEWAKWLPHVRPAGTPRILWTPADVTRWAAAAHRGWEPPARPIEPDHLTMVVCDEPQWWLQRSAPLRALMSEPSMPLRFVLVAADAADVPALCTTVIRLSDDDHGGAPGVTMDLLTTRRHVGGIHAYLASDELATTVARRLASLDDPEVPVAAASELPEELSLLGLVGLDPPTPRQLTGRWSATRADQVRATIGLTERGPLTVALASGPHAVVAGADGSGRRELMRTWLTSLVIAHSPDDVQLLLVDTATDSTFAGVDALAHVTAIVRTLDTHLANRLLRSLRAEVERRRRGGSHPRLVVMIADLDAVHAAAPDMLTSLVDLLADPTGTADTLGIHLVVGTRGGAGIEPRMLRDADIRIALRVDHDGDAIDLVGTSDAAHIARRLRGRGVVRIGSGEPIAFQAARVTTGSAPPPDPGPYGATIAPFVVAREPSALEARLARVRNASTAGEETTDLDRVVECVVAVGPPRGAAVVVDPLPERLGSEFIAQHPGDGVPYALVDEPDHQRQTAVWWAPGPQAGLVASGSLGAGTSSLLAVLALGIAQRYSADDVHVYVIDGPHGDLAALDGLAHVGAVIDAADTARLARLARLINTLVTERRAGANRDRPDAQPAIVVMIDGVDALEQALIGEANERLWAELGDGLVAGSRLGVHLVATTEHPRGVPARLAPLIATELLMRPADPVAVTALGFAAVDIPTFVPGRALRLADGAELQVAEPPPSLAAAVAGVAAEPAVERLVRRLDPIPERVRFSALAANATIDERCINVPIGLDLDHGEPALLRMCFGSTVVVAGPRGSGRSSVLAALAATVARLAPDVATSAVASADGPLGAEIDAARLLEDPSSPDAARWLAAVRDGPGRRIVFVDDADRVHGALFDSLAALDDDDLVIVVAGTGDGLRTDGHWWRPTRAAGGGLLLRPGPGDAALFGATLTPRPARSAGARPNPRHGVLVSGGSTTAVLVATFVPGADVGTFAPPARPANPGGT